MKKTTIAALLVGGALAASQSAFGQFVSNDLYLGFQNAAGGGTSDYVINLGSVSSYNLGASSTIDLSSLFSLSDFNAVLGSSSSLIMGAVGGSQSSSADIYLTQLRTGGAGTPSVAGSSVTATPTRGGIQNAVSTLNQVTSLPAVGTGALDSGLQWQTYVDPALPTASTFNGNAPSPDAPFYTSDNVAYLDLWSAAKSTLSGTTSYVYDGYFTLDLNGASPSLMFTPTDVPEPGSCALIGGGSLLMLAMRRRMAKKTN